MRGTADPSASSDGHGSRTPPVQVDGGEFSLDRGGAVSFGTPTLDAGTTVTVAER